MIPVINYWAVLVSAIVSMWVGFMWYGPIFGKMWLKLARIDHQDIEVAKRRGMWKIYLISFIGSLLTAYALAHGLIFGNAYLGMSGIGAGLQGAFWYWLGFFVPVTASAYLWEGKPAKLWWLNAAYYLVSLGVMSVILTVWE